MSGELLPFLTVDSWGAARATAGQGSSTLKETEDSLAALALYLAFSQMLVEISG